MHELSPFLLRTRDPLLYTESVDLHVSVRPSHIKLHFCVQNPSFTRRLLIARTHEPKVRAALKKSGIEFAKKKKKRLQEPGVNGIRRRLPGRA